MYRIYLSRSMRDLKPEPFSFQSPPQKLPDSVQWRQYTSIFILVLLILEIVAQEIRQLRTLRVELTVGSHPSSSR